MRELRFGLVDQARAEIAALRAKSELADKRCELLNDQHPATLNTHEMSFVLRHLDIEGKKT